MTSTRQDRNRFRHISPRATIAALAIALALTVVASQAAQAQTYKVLYNFTGGQDGAYPNAGVTIDKAGNLYGTASELGGSGFGTVFKLSYKGSGWIFTPLYSFGSLAEFVGKRAVEKAAPWKSPRAGLSSSAWKSRESGGISTFPTAPATTG